MIFFEPGDMICVDRSERFRAASICLVIETNDSGEILQWIWLDECNVYNWHYIGLDAAYATELLTAGRTIIHRRDCGQ